ncbi:hypothetical protein J1614_001342 [Plenodomus biglobosus]|nr:hypothetical protein J1614_001342 [Plenodomus biglobosus]
MAGYLLFQTFDDVKKWAEENFADSFATLPDPGCMLPQTFKGSRDMEHLIYSGVVFTEFYPPMYYHVPGEGAVKVLATILGNSLKACEVRNECVVRVTPLLHWLKHYGPDFMDAFKENSEQDGILIALEVEAVIRYYLAANGSIAALDCEQRLFAWNLHRACERIGKQFLNPVTAPEGLLAIEPRPATEVEPATLDNTHHIVEAAVSSNPNLQEEASNATETSCHHPQDKQRKLHIEDSAARAHEYEDEFSSRLTDLSEAHDVVRANFEALKQAHLVLGFNYDTLESRHAALRKEYTALRNEHMAEKSKLADLELKHDSLLTKVTILESRMDTACCGLCTLQRQTSAIDIRARVKQEDNNSHFGVIEPDVGMLRNRLNERDTEEALANMRPAYSGKGKDKALESDSGGVQIQ